MRRGSRPSIPAFSFLLNALFHWVCRLKVMIVDFSYLWRLAHDKWGIYAKADRRVEPDLTGDDGRQSSMSVRRSSRLFVVDSVTTKSIALRRVVAQQSEQ